MGTHRDREGRGEGIWGKQEEREPQVRMPGLDTCNCYCLLVLSSPHNGPSPPAGRIPATWVLTSEPINNAAAKGKVRHCAPGGGR